MDCSFRALPLAGGVAEFFIYDPISDAEKDSVFEKIRAESLRLEKIFNIFDSESEVSRLNERRSGVVSSELLELISLCLPYCNLTCGRYDITLGKSIAIRKSGGRDVEVKCSYKDLSIDGNFVSFSHPDLMLDFGSAAKGFIGDKLASLMKALGVKEAFIDLRGDMVSYGEVGETIWIQHPRCKEEALFSFPLKNRSVATSGDYKQYYGDYSRSHIINSSDVISATVVADTLAEADILATCLFVMGTSKLDAFLGRDYLIVDNNFRILKSRGFENEWC